MNQNPQTTQYDIDHPDPSYREEAPDQMHGPGHAQAESRPELVPIYLRDQFSYNEQRKRLEPLQSALRGLSEEANYVYHERKTKIKGDGELTKALNRVHDRLGTGWIKNSIIYGIAKTAAKEICGQINRINSLSISLQREEESPSDGDLDKKQQFLNMIEESENSLDSAILLARWCEENDVEVLFEVGANDALWMEANRQTRLMPTGDARPQQSRVAVRDRLAKGL